jgi:hypothetical protein
MKKSYALYDETDTRISSAAQMTEEEAAQANEFRARLQQRGEWREYSVALPPRK